MLSLYRRPRQNRDGVHLDSVIRMAANREYLGILTPAFFCAPTPEIPRCRDSTPGSKKIRDDPPLQRFDAASFAAGLHSPLAMTQRHPASTIGAR